MEFRDWLFTEIKGQDIAAHINKDDAEYLNQFPDNRQAQALHVRYQLLKQALTAKGEVRRTWNDNQAIMLRGHGKDEVYRIDTKIRPLVEKLRQQGIDPREAELSKISAYQAVHYWRKISNPRMARRGFETPDLMHLPGSSVPLKSKTPMVPKSYWDRSNLTWNDATEELRHKVIIIVNRLLSNLAQNPEHTLHINYFYWSEPYHKKDLINSAMAFLKSRYEDHIKELIDNEAGLRSILYNYCTSKLQNGLVSRRAIAASGLNIPKLLKTGYGAHEIADRINHGEGATKVAI